MINRIIMKNCASYNETGVVIDVCDKVNFIYGHNGSGKSTISNFLTTPNEPKFDDCSLVWKMGTEGNILVYNKAFRERNMQSTDMPGVFTLGEATAEQLAELERLSEERERRRKEFQDILYNLEQKKKEYSSLLSDYESAVWEQIFKRNDNTFKDAFLGLRAKKALFFQKIRDQYKNGVKTSRTRIDIEATAATLFGQKPERENQLISPSFDIANEIEENELWGKVIVGNKDINISGLIESLNISDWVKAGQAYIRETDICPFCQRKTIDTNLRAQFEAYFGGEYERQTELLSTFYNRYCNFFEKISAELKQLIESASKLSIEIDIEILKTKTAEYLSLLNSNLSIIEDKCSEPSRTFEIKLSKSSSEQILNILCDINKKIDKHNMMIDNYKTEKEALIRDIWGLIITENKNFLSGYEAKLTGTQKAVESMTNSVRKSENLIKELNDRITDANKHIISVQPTVDAINRSLKAYGFEGFSIVSSHQNPNRYQIKRPNGEIATETLSEGEETFISFLYFMNMTQGGLNQESISQHKVIVIDDPICSLDSSILYVVSSMVRELIDCAKKGVKNIDQIFILTHNVYFHKEISFIDGRDKEDAKTKFWMLKKKNEVTYCKSFERKNPIKTTYALLWSEVKANEEISTVSLQNAMRRILENFFGTLGNANSSTILQYFESPEEKDICRSLFSWVNDGSHSIPDDLEFSENTDASDKYRKVFKDIFYKTHNEYHYDRMME